MAGTLKGARYSRVRKTFAASALSPTKTSFCGSKSSTGLSMISGLCIRIEYAPKCCRISPRREFQLGSLTAVASSSRKGTPARKAMLAKLHQPVESCPTYTSEFNKLESPAFMASIKFCWCPPPLFPRKRRISLPSASKARAPPR